MLRFSLGKVAGVGVAFLLLVLSVSSAASSGEKRYRKGEILIRYRVEAMPEEKRPEANTRSARSSSSLTDSRRPRNLLQIDERFGLLGQRRLWASEKLTENHAATVMRESIPSVNGERACSDEVETWLLKFDPERDIEEIIEAYRRDPRVIIAEPNYVGRLCFLPTDPLYAETAGDLAMIDAEAAWDAQPGANEHVTVAVIDSGIEKDHPDLREALDLERSYNFVDSNNEIFDDMGHGTRVAGIIGARANNGEGIAGLAFGCSLISLDVTNSEGEVSAADVVSALNWALAEGAQVVNMSLVFDVKSQLLEEACQAAYSEGVLLVAAAGNEDRGDRPVYPASFASVIGVGATRDGAPLRAPWSNFNGVETDLVELAAPGATVFSTIPGSQYNGTYGTGTSFAAPMVAGAAALLGAKYPGMSASAIRSHLRSTARPLGDWAGAGLLDAGAALSAPIIPEVHVAEILVDDDLAYDIMNDGDGRLDEGETVRLSVRLTNKGADVAKLEGDLTSLDAEILTSQTTALWPFLPCDLEVGDDGVSSDTASFDGLTYIAAQPVVKAVWFRLDLSANAGDYQTSLTFSIATENAFTPLPILGASTTWTADKTIVITSQTVVMEEATLTIEPGTTIRFGPEGGLEVRGGIKAQGTASEQICFTAIEEGPGGGFSQQNLPVGPNPKALAVGDINHDGFKDILCLTASSGLNNPSGMSLLLGNFSGFLSEIRGTIGIAESNDITNLNISDFNGDGMDEVLYNGRLYDWTEEGFVDKGALSVEEFRAARDSFPDSIDGQWDNFTYVADVDGDQDNDIVTLVLDGENMEQKMQVRLWNGATLDPPIEIPVSISSVFVHINDALNNGENEILISDAMGTISIFSWQTDHVEQVKTLETGSYPKALSVADVDQDGDNDVLVSHQSHGDILLFRWNGFSHEESELLAKGDSSQNISSLVVADMNNDGFQDVVASRMNLGKITLILWDAKRFGVPKYRGINLNPTAFQADIAFCRFEYAPVRDASDVSAFFDCVFQGSGSTWSYSSEPTTGSTKVIRCEVLDNDGGGGILAPGRILEDCVAKRNAGVGLEGERLVNCFAEENRGAGMSGQSASGCLAFGNFGDGIITQGDVTESGAHWNGGWGIRAGGTVESTSATHNMSGITGLETTECEASWNQGMGIEVSGKSILSRAVKNGQFGIKGGSLINCVVVGNGYGLDLSSIGSSATQCLIAENKFFGAMGGVIHSSVIHHNAGPGSGSAKAISNSWIVGNVGPGVNSAESVTKSAVLRNGSVGVSGRQGEPYTSISDSIIQRNSLSGVKRVDPMNGCNISENAILSGTDYEEDRASSELTQANLTGNYWGSETTVLMNAHPSGSHYDIPRILDFHDNTLLTEADYGGHLASEALTAGPDDSAPAFLLSFDIAPGSDGVVGVGVTTFTLIFSKAMRTDSSASLSVTFGLAEPHDRHVVAPWRHSGWLNSTTWQGAFAVQSDTGDGVNRLSVRGALAENGFALPPDTSHTFTVDTSGKGGANNGKALLHTAGGLKITWTDEGRPLDSQGFNIRRSVTGAPGSYQRLNSQIITGTEFHDNTISPNVIYFYIVDMVDALGHSIQWTPPFYGSSSVAPVRGGWWIY